MHDHHLAPGVEVGAPTGRGAPIHCGVIVHFAVGLRSTDANYKGVEFIFAGSGPVAVLSVLC